MKTTLASILHAPPQRLGLFRAALGVYLLIYLLVRLPVFVQLTANDEGSYAPVGLLNWLGQSYPSSSLAWSIYACSVVLALAFTMGAFFRFTGPLLSLAVLWLTSYKSSFAMVFHSENLVCLQTIAIGCAPSAQAFSWDARRRAPSPSSIPSGWPLFAASLITIVSYLLAGIAKWKLSGLDWATGDVLRIQVAYDNLRKIELGSMHSPIGAWTVKHAWLFPPLGLLTMVAELGGPLALVHRRIALLWTILVVGFHWGVLLLMAITFSYPLTGIPFFCLFEIENSRLGRYLLNRWYQAPPS